MQVLLTGASGELGRKYISLFPNTDTVKVRYKDLEDYRKKLHGVDVVIHASANLFPITIEEALLDNVLLPLKMAEMAYRKKKDIHFIFISSMSILDRYRNVKRIDDLDLYPMSKFILESLIKKNKDINSTIIRFSTLFFENPIRDGLSKMIYSSKTFKKVSTVSCRRDFIPADIACLMLNKICGNSEWYSKSVNLASGKSYNMQDVAYYLRDKYGTEVNLIDRNYIDDVCYDFNTDDIASLGNFNFDLFDRIDKYHNFKD